MATCVALLSGGLDSILAIRLMQEQGIDVEALNFKTAFTCCQDQSGQAANELGVRLTILGHDDDYLDIVKHPRFGYGKGANPCVDCRIYMFQRAKKFMEQIGAQFVISGEIVGQRPMSQKRRDLAVISHHSDLEDVLLRPLSARLLPPTKPEREGLVQRDKLYDFHGRSRKGLIQLARQLGVRQIPTPSTGCALTEPRFSRKVFDLIELDPDACAWDFAILKLGRHFRLDAATKVIIGRNEDDNTQLEYHHGLRDARSTAIFYPANFTGPLGMLIGPLHSQSIEFVGGLMIRYAREADPAGAQVEVVERKRRYVVRLQESEAAANARTVATM